MTNRTEKDSIGEVRIEKGCLGGAQTQRAIDNFAISSYRISPDLIWAMAQVKKACCLANLETGYLEQDKADAIAQACDEIIKGKYDDQFMVDAMQGGAGTSTNMNFNEVIANVALGIAGRQAGEYDYIHPIDHVNMHQSTNDVYPTAVKVAVLKKIRVLATAIEKLQGAFQKKEKEFSSVVKMGRTEMQLAVPMTLGAEFSAFAGAIERDRWRVFKCEERIRQVNLGGTAVGTGLTSPRSYIFLVIEKLRELTGFGLARGENTVDQTANNDCFVEIAGILKAHCSNMIKICGDLRMLNMLGEIKLEPVQAGSSIMPGKINPVVAEAVIQTSIKAASDCDMVFEAASRSSFQITEFMPLLSFSILEALDLLARANAILSEHVEKIISNADVCMKYTSGALSIITAFVPRIGYQKCEDILKEFLSSGESDLKMFLKEKLGKETVEEIFSPENLMALGHADNEKNT